jgi:hypothetical protein
MERICGSTVECVNELVDNIFAVSKTPTITINFLDSFKDNIEKEIFKFEFSCFKNDENGITA